MMFGDGPDDAELHHAWTAFCDRLEEAGAQIFKDHNPVSGVHRVDALRFLTQNLGQAFDLALETRDAARARGLGRNPRVYLTPFVVRVVARAHEQGDALAARGLGD